MTTDIELLELAAKAAGWTGWRSKHGYWNVTSPDGEDRVCCHYWNTYCPSTGEKLQEPTFADAIEETNWNPLTDDGDALRLAVKLKLLVVVAKWSSSATDGGFNMELTQTFHEDFEDPYAATRRTIVRAAAEIGKAK